jgi:hypothetical protein
MSAPYESNNTCSLQHELPLAQIPIQILYVARLFLLRLLLYIVPFAKIDSSRLVNSCQQGRRHLKSGTAELLTNTSRPEMSHLYQTADDLGFVAHFLPVRRGTLGVVSRTMVNLNQGLFTALVKAPCVVSLHVGYFLIRTVYQIALWSPSRLMKHTTIGTLPTFLKSSPYRP